MAIKGKKKPRGGGGPRPGVVAPRPKIDARKPPMIKRPWFKRLFVGSSALLVLFIALTVQGRMHRTNALRAYDRALTKAERPFQQSTEAGPDAITTVAEGFGAKTVTPKELRADVTKWEENFRTAAQNVRGLKPPKELIEANNTIAASLDAYAAVARLYAVAATQREIALATKDAALGKKLEAALTELLTNITDARTRADGLRQAARTQINELKARWGIKVTAPPASDGAPQGGLPGGLPQGIVPS